MNSRELETIQEAYLNIYSQYLTELDTWNPSSDAPRKEGNINTRQSSPGYKLSPNKKWTPPVATPGQYLPQAKKEKEKNKDTQMSHYDYEDIFDFIMEYLISEGYADTNQGALVIMTNMSDKWKNSITEEFISEMRKEDKVKGKKKTSLYNTRIRKKLDKDPGDKGGGWKLKKIEDKILNPSVAMAKTRKTLSGGIHRHGEGGIHRGVKKSEQKNAPEPKLNVYQRKRELKIKTGVPVTSVLGDRAQRAKAEAAKKNFKSSSKNWDNYKLKESFIDKISNVFELS